MGLRGVWPNSISDLKCPNPNICSFFVKTDPSLFFEVLLPPLLGFHSVPSLTFNLTVLAHVSTPNLHCSIFGPVFVCSVRASVLTPFVRFYSSVIFS